MADNYQEGPLANWTGISFPSGFTYQVVSVVSNTLNNIVQIRQFPADPLSGTFDPSKLQGIITGNVSGASVDLRSLPITDPTPTNSTGPPMSCTVTQTGYHYYPSGTLVPSGAAPWLAASIHDARDDFAGGVYVLIRGQPSYSPELIKPDPEDPETWFYLCATDANPPACPAFVASETCTITYEV